MDVYLQLLGGEHVIGMPVVAHGEFDVFQLLGDVLGEGVGGLVERKDVVPFTVNGQGAVLGFIQAFVEFAVDHETVVQMIALAVRLVDRSDVEHSVCRFLRVVGLVLLTEDRARFGDLNDMGIRGIQLDEVGGARDVDGHLLDVKGSVLVLDDHVEGFRGPDALAQSLRALVQRIGVLPSGFVDGQGAVFPLHRENYIGGRLAFERSLRRKAEGVGVALVRVFDLVDRTRGGGRVIFGDAQLRVFEGQLGLVVGARDLDLEPLLGEKAVLVRDGNPQFKLGVRVSVDDFSRLEPVDLVRVVVELKPVFPGLGIQEVGAVAGNNKVLDAVGTNIRSAIVGDREGKLGVAVIVGDLYLLDVGLVAVLGQLHIAPVRDAEFLHGDGASLYVGHVVRALDKYINGFFVIGPVLVGNADGVRKGNLVPGLELVYYVFVVVEYERVPSGLAVDNQFAIFVYDLGDGFAGFVDERIGKLRAIIHVSALSCAVGFGLAHVVHTAVLFEVLSRFDHFQRFEIVVILER